MAETVFGSLRKSVEANVESVVETIVGGSVKDYAEYMHLRGLVRGLRTAIVLIDKLEDSYVNGDDDD